jgi:deazaflavin-dependent oxidoreductase (nitroreductase family)
VSDLDAHDYVYVTTRGRRTGRPHTIEIWFAARGSTLYLLAGGGERSDWVRNLQADPSVVAKLGDRAYRGHARVVTEPEESRLAREIVPHKYREWEGGLEEWADTALPIAIDLGV